MISASSGDTDAGVAGAVLRGTGARVVSTPRSAAATGAVSDAFLVTVAVVGAAVVVSAAAAAAAAGRGGASALRSPPFSSTSRILNS